MVLQGHFQNLSSSWKHIFGSGQEISRRIGSQKWIRSNDEEQVSGWLQVKVNLLQQLQFQSREELNALSLSPNVVSGIPSAEGATAGRGVQGRIVKAKKLTHVPSPKGDGCLLTKVNVLPAHAFGRLRSITKKELSAFLTGQFNSAVE